MRQIGKLIKKSFELGGLNVSRNRPQPSSPLVYFQIDVVLDVGANVGQYALGAREAHFKKTIVSFEPLSEAHKRLVEKSKNDGNWIVHERCAVGSEIGETEINISENSDSSSLLPMLAAHSDAAPESRYVGKDLIRIITLDSIYHTYCRTNERVFLKIDAQGYEKQVLDGAKDCLKYIKGVQVELSVVPLYASQNTYEYFFQLFKDHGFALWSLLPVFTDPRTGRMLQFDAVFIRLS
jgi:FkbM family methyltransferase